MVVPARTGHPRDLLVWHGLSAGCMAAMLAAAQPRWFSEAGVAVYAVGITWCLVQAARLSRRAAYARLAVCCLAMLVMLIPARTSHPMPGPPGLLTGTLLAALVWVALTGAVRAVPSAGPGGHRAAGLVEGLLAGAMAAMLAGVL
jgi:hypothetical protein